MKSWISTKAVIFGAALLFSAQSYAVTCLAPTPICLAVVVGQIWIGSHAGTPQEMEAFAVGLDEAKIRAVVEAVREAEDGLLVLRIIRRAQYNPGYSEIIKRYEDGRFTGRLSLQSMYEFTPSTFEDLDALYSILSSEFGEEVASRLYGPARIKNQINWRRYALLAQEALALDHNLFVK